MLEVLAFVATIAFSFVVYLAFWIRDAVLDVEQERDADDRVS
jgi:hypothetical protein